MVSKISLATKFGDFTKCGVILRSGRVIERNNVWPPRPERPRAGGEENIALYRANLSDF